MKHTTIVKPIPSSLYTQNYNKIITIDYGFSITTFYNLLQKKKNHENPFYIMQILIQLNSYYYIETTFEWATASKNIYRYMGSEAPTIRAYNPAYYSLMQITNIN